MLLVFFTGIVGLIVYLLVRPQGNTVPCPNCGNKRLQTCVKCPNCGA
jgi:transposase